MESRVTGGTTTRLGLVVEEYCSFIGNEIRALRTVGADLVLLAAFRPLPERDPADEELRREALYFPSAASVLASVAAAIARTPRAFAAVVIRMVREGVGVRMAALACCFARLARARRIRHLHAIYSTRTATLAWGISRLAGVGYSFSTHANDMWNNPSIGWKARDATFVRTISAFNRAFLAKAYGVDEERIAVCRLGVDTSRPLRRSSPANGAPRILCVGRLAESKGHLFLLDACAQLHSLGLSFACRIVGSGPQEQILRRRIHDLSLERHVRLEGWLTHAETLQCFEEADIFALACIDDRADAGAMDGIPVALMEAMAASVPVVSTPISGIPELVEDGRSGILVPERSADALAAALRRLLVDPELRRRLGTAGRERVAEAFELLRNAVELRQRLERAANGVNDPERR
jgi:glycosyltransferase involved in cell wall biosynthesis